MHHVSQALRAHTLYKRDVNYLVEDGKVLIVDEHTGRKMPGRRWSDGLHQAIEAKENVTVEEENQTLATVTFQNLFRMYHKLGGMTGTADTEAAEFHEIYKLDVVQIPTNKPMVRVDNADLVYKNERGKFRAVMNEIVERHAKGQPVLVGTVSVEKSEVLSRMLTQKDIKHVVLNAKYHMREAEIVAQAGRKSAVTISTNMAGRGTDVLLGGNAEFMARAEVGGHEAAAIPGAVDETTPEYKEALAKFKAQCDAEKEEVRAAGGLHILGTERHESRRIDNQLRGRAGRQGDPGSSRFYLSLEDDLLRIFGAERITGLMERLGMEEDVPIEHGLVNRAIENAQRKVEGHNFDIRKNLLDYDDVMNQQRKTIYAMRKQILEGRYIPELSAEDQKKGKEPPPPPPSSGDWTIDSLAESLKPRVAQIVDGFLAGVPEAKDGTVDPYRTDANTPPTDGKVLDPEKLTHELYRQFGAVVDVKKDLKDRTALVDKAAQVAAQSLIQQRERVLDLSDRADLRHRVDALLREVARRGLGLEGARRRGQRAVQHRGRRRDEPGRARRAVGEDLGAGRDLHQGARDRARAAHLLLLRAPLRARGDRRAVDRSFEVDGSAARGHRPRRVRSERPEDRVQKRRLYDVPADDGAHRGQRRAQALSSAFGEAAAARRRDGTAAAAREGREREAARVQAQGAAHGGAARVVGRGGLGDGIGRVGSGRRRASRGGAGEAKDGAARGAQGRPQRAVPVRQRQKVQKVPRRRRRRLIPRIRVI